MEEEQREKLLYFFSPETIDALENESDYSFSEYRCVKTYDWRIIDWIDHLVTNHNQFPELTNRYGSNPKRAVRRMVDAFLSALEDIGVRKPELLVCHAEFFCELGFSSVRFEDPNDLVREWLEIYNKEDIKEALNEHFDYIPDFVRTMDELTEFRRSLE